MQIIPQIRLFDVPEHTIHPLPQREGNGEWKVCSSTIAKFSATGYYFEEGFTMNSMSRLG